MEDTFGDDEAGSRMFVRSGEVVRASGAREVSKWVDLARMRGRSGRPAGTWRAVAGRAARRSAAPTGRVRPPAWQPGGSARRAHDAGEVWPGCVGCTEGSRFRTRPARRQRPAWPALFREDRCRWRARTPSGPARHAGSRGRATCRPRQCALSPGPRRLAAVGTDMCDRSSCRWRYRRIGAGCPSWPRPIVTTRWDASARFAR